MTPAELPVLTIDGTRFDDFAGFAREFSALLDNHTWHGHPDAFNDILSGGFGTPEDGYVLRWLASQRSRELLGAQFEEVVATIRGHGPGGARSESRVCLELR